MALAWKVECEDIKEYAFWGRESDLENIFKRVAYNR